MIMKPIYRSLSEREFHNGQCFSLTANGASNWYTVGIPYFFSRGHFSGLAHSFSLFLL